MKQRELSYTLTAILEHDVPATTDLWPRVRDQVRSRRPATALRRLSPITRPGWVLLGLALVLALSAVTYASVPAVMRLFTEPPILDGPTQADLIQPLGLQETVDGFTVTLVQGYADADRVVLGFTVEVPEGQRYEPHRLTLTDPAGNDLPWVHGYGATGNSELFGLSLPSGEGVYAHVFDASALPVTDGDLTLTFAMDLTELPPPSDASAAPGTVQPEGLSSPAIELTPLPPAKSVGPFTFQFSLTR